MSRTDGGAFRLWGGVPATACYGRSHGPPHPAINTCQVPPQRVGGGQPGPPPPAAGRHHYRPSGDQDADRVARSDMRWRGTRLSAVLFNRRNLWWMYLLAGSLGVALYVFVAPFKSSGPVINGLGLSGVVAVMMG